MIRFGKKVVHYRIPILILSVLLLIPSVLGMIGTKVNYDMLYYLPGDIDTMIGQDILMDDFGKGAFSLFMTEGMSPQEVSALKQKLEQVEHVDSVVWYDSIADISIPMELLPEEYLSKFHSGSVDLMAIFFDDTTSADTTMKAIETIRSIAGKQTFLSGMSAVVTDTKNLSKKETPVYVLIAVLLSCVVLALTMESWLLPLFFMLSIGMAVLYNLGSNYFLGEISYVTKALSAVLQLGVTMDYSIFLWHSYSEQKERFQGDKNRAMAHAISNTITSVVGSSVTTIAGFIALCFMSFTLGKDLGVVMAKGVVFGVLGCVTILPSMILVFDRAVEKTTHQPLLPDLGTLAGVISRHHFLFITIFLALLAPAIYGYTHTEVYYNLDETLPKDLDSIAANTKLAETFDMNSVHMVLADSSMLPKDAVAMMNEMKAQTGVSFALGFDSLAGTSIPRELIPSDLQSLLKSERWQLILVGSEYKTATEEVNQQIEVLNTIVKKYDANALVIGEAPCTKDLIEITDQDFKVVSIISICAIFLIIAFVFRSISLPIILVSVIEFAIFINMGIPCYTKTALPFIASIVIGTIQLGATVDYAILMTNRYKKERNRGETKENSIQIALSASIKSVMVSAFGFFAATFGVGLYSDIDMISSLCSLMARGAIISMFVVLLLLPSLFMVFDRVICATSFHFAPVRKKEASHSNGPVPVQ